MSTGSKLYQIRLHAPIFENLILFLSVFKIRPQNLIKEKNRIVLTTFIKKNGMFGLISMGFFFFRQISFSFTYNFCRKF